MSPVSDIWLRMKSFNSKLEKNGASNDKPDGKLGYKRFHDLFHKQHSFLPQPIK